SGLSGESDAFVVKFSSQGAEMIYSTYLGGVLYDAGASIAVDASGSAYVTGETRSINFPTKNPLQPAQLKHFFNPNDPSSASEAFVAKLSPTGAALSYSTYLGGSGMDRGNGIAVDTMGNAYVVGITSSTDFPITTGAFQTALADQRLFPSLPSGD